MSAVVDDRVLVLTRTIAAPRALVWQAWTDPEHARRWGPRGFTVVHLEGELRPGGAWRLCMRADDGSRELWQGGVYREVVPPERLVFTFAWDDEAGRPGHETLVTLTLEERGSKETRLTLRQAVFATVASRDGHAQGWGEALDRLAEHVATLLAGGPG